VARVKDLERLLEEANALRARQNRAIEDAKDGWIGQRMPLILSDV